MLELDERKAERSDEDWTFISYYNQLIISLIAKIIFIHNQAALRFNFLDQNPSLAFLIVPLGDN